MPSGTKEGESHNNKSRRAPRRQFRISIMVRPSSFCPKQIKQTKRQQLLLKAGQCSAFALRLIFLTMISKQNQPWRVSISQRCIRPTHSPLNSPVYPRMRPCKLFPSLLRMISAVKLMPQSKSSQGRRSQFQPKVQLTCREDEPQLTSGSRSTSKGLTSSACYLSASLNLARR